MCLYETMRAFKDKLHTVERNRDQSYQEAYTVSLSATQPKILFICCFQDYNAR